MNLLSRLRGSRSTDLPNRNPLYFNFARSRQRMLALLQESELNDTVVGIYAPVLGDGMFLTTVEQIHFLTGDTIVVLNQFELSGGLLHKSILSVNEIHTVCPFPVPYRHPILDNFILT